MTDFGLRLLSAMVILIVAPNSKDSPCFVSFLCLDLTKALFAKMLKLQVQDFSL